MYFQCNWLFFHKNWSDGINLVEKLIRKLAQWFWRKILLNFVNVFLLFRIYFPLEKEWPFIWTNLNTIYPSMLCGKFFRNFTQTFFSFQRQYKKLENSMCVVSYSIDYVEKYHIPLAKSLMEYSNRKDLRIKRAVIREPEHLNSIPPSKVCTCIKVAQPLEFFYARLWRDVLWYSVVLLSVCCRPNQ